MASSAWSEFHIAILSNDSTLFPSFPSKELSGGDADKILLGDIRKYAAVSPKLRFTADGKTVLSDETTLSYYLSLKDGNLDGLRKNNAPAVEAANPASDTDAQKKPAIATVQVDLILNSAGGNGGDGKKANVSVDLAKIQESTSKMIEQMNSDGAVKLGDLQKLSDSLGALRTDSMNFGTVAGKVNYPEPLDLTEWQWDVVLRNNRALHGWFYKDGMLVKARKRAFQLTPNPDVQPSHPQNPVGTTTTGKKETPAPVNGPAPPVPPFYVWDDASVEVTEMTSALEKTMANQGFSSTAVRAAGGGGAMEIQGTASLAVEKEHSTASKKLEAKQVNSVHVSYKFPRAAVEVDAYCLQLTEECKREALACRVRADVDRWEREYGSVFATKFTLGGELISSRLFHGTDDAELSAFKDSVKVAAGLSLSTPYGSAGASYGSLDSNESTKGERKAQQSVRLAWQARGGDTLLCSSPTLWANTVKDYRLWRIMDQEGMVRMRDLVKTVDLKAGIFLENPESASKRESESKGGRDSQQVWNILSNALKNDQNPLARKIKEFYESKSFSLEEFNASLPLDGAELKLTDKSSWPALSPEQKVYVGLLCYDKKLISID
ncbi:hypothetical protein B0I37DRAFT_414420 [Chaetomium sp. MPI-CAGE-AT-0009]|nr:hypothetical protein B0I37DRAFT_414420 [Chaetomium sp. MPI-CAGE-AT-0009]